MAKQTGNVAAGSRSKKGDTVMDIMQRDEKYIAHTYGRFPIVIDHGCGSVVVDANGKEYIDLSSGIAVDTFGISDKKWVEAVEKQLEKMQHISNLYYTEPATTLAAMLCERTGMKKVFFSNSGAEANECAIKAARKYSQDKKGKDYYNIITLKNSFHGRTLSTLAATGQDAFHELFTPLTPGFLYAEVNDFESVKKLLDENKCAGVMIEIVQGEGGVIALDREFVKGVYDLCNELDVPLICDEVQIGNGRSGKLYAYMNYDIKPNIVSTAKGLGGGLPLGATMLDEKLSDVLTPGTHGSTFGGNPVCCAGAISILERLDDKLLSEVREKSAYIVEELEKAEGVICVTGMGLMLGVKTKRDVNEIINECMEKGVLVIKAKDKLRLLPALNIPMDKLKVAIAVIKTACAKV